MERDYTQEQKYLKAKKRVEKIRGFYIHVFVTALLIPALIFFNLKFVPEFHWFYFAVTGLLFGVFFHWLGVFGFDKVGLGKEWEEKKIRELMEENKK